MRHVLIGIGIGIIVVLAGVLILAFYSGLLGRTAVSPTPSSPPVTTTSPRPPGTSAASPNGTGAKVTFDMMITGISGTGLSRTVTAQVINTGSSDAHNVWAKVEAFSQGQRVQISSQDYLRVDIGEIKAGATVKPQATLSFTLVDGLKIQQNGAQFQLTIYSDEKIQSLTYDYKP
jgi:hypothetical protein